MAPAPTSTTVLSSPEPSNPDGPVFVTARVIVAALGSGRPTGTVTIDFGDGTPAAVQTLVDGVATATHTYPAVDGTCTITAFYSGDTDYASSTDTRTHRVPFSTVKLRTKVTRGAGSPAAALAMVFKLAESAQARWRAVTAPQLVALVRAGACFEGGQLIERPGAQAA